MIEIFYYDNYTPLQREKTLVEYLNEINKTHTIISVVYVSGDYEIVAIKR